MKYDLREIMIRAWRNFRKFQITFAEALHRAWISAKAAPVEVASGRMPALLTRTSRRS